ncbi:MAG TPA: phytanoyl-CoA dioxygenase family protein [Verrucomicrobiae bacterium]|nr:phytanoyl-CoA dioxygenase family protein [Verrucomicrobiae bacterium]
MSASSTSHAIKRFSVDADPSDVLAELDSTGAAIVERVVQGEALAQLKGEMGAWFDATPQGEGQFFGKLTRRFSGVFAKAPSTQALAIHPLVLAVMRAHLRGPDPSKPHCDDIELSATQAIGIGAGEGAQYLHRDEALWPFAHDFPVMANAMWMIDDFTEDNGATRLIPKSHLWPEDREPEVGDTVRAEGPAGSVLLWTGKTLHAGGENRTQRMRRGLVLSYKVGWLAPQEKLLLSHPPEIARSYSDDLQILLGYAVQRPNLGWIEGRDPRDWLAGEFTNLAATRDNLTPELEQMLAHVRDNQHEFKAYFA